jgi:hypothetical protein
MEYNSKHFGDLYQLCPRDNVLNKSDRCLYWSALIMACVWIRSPVTSECLNWCRAHSILAPVGRAIITQRRRLPDPVWACWDFYRQCAQTLARCLARSITRVMSPRVLWNLLSSSFCKLLLQGLHQPQAPRLPTTWLARGAPSRTESEPALASSIWFYCRYD